MRVFFKAGVRKDFSKITGKKQLRRSLFLIKLHAHSKLFTGDWFGNLLEPSTVFGPVKNLVKMYKFLLKLNLNTKSLNYLKITETAIGGVLQGAH